MAAIHGLAASIRAAQESETFDLGGQSSANITSTVDAAFAEPFALQEMIRITFVTGAGKQARQKYDDTAARSVTTALQEHGYSEDRGASCVLESAGSYKLQHDTGKNLKTVVVFPKIVSPGGEAPEEAVESLIPENSPGYKIAVSSMNVFENMIKSNCPSWSQKKGCLTCLEGLKELLQELDAQLMKGTPLTDSEQTFYENVASNLDEKETLVRQMAQTQVEQGKITSFERDLLLQHNAERIATLEKEKKSTAKALQRKKLLESMDPIAPLKLKHHAKIGRLHKELSPLLQMETKGRLLSIKQTAAMTRRDEIFQEIEYLENASRGWFENDDTFASRLEASRSEFQAAAKKHKKTTVISTAGGTAKGKEGAAVNKWVTPGEGRGGYASSSKKKKGKQARGNLFGAMMLDSSDEEASEKEEEKKATDKGRGNDKQEQLKPDVDSNRDRSAKKKSNRKRKKPKKRVAKEEEEAGASCILTTEPGESRQRR